MERSSSSASLTDYFFIVLIIAGVSMFAVSFFLGITGGLFYGIRQIALGIIFIGIGEWVNHPLQKSMVMQGEKNVKFRKFTHRKRSPSGLGSLLEIIGLLLLFIGIADYM